MIQLTLRGNLDMKKLVAVSFISTFLHLGLSLSFFSFAVAADPIRVTVSILPQKYVVEKIGGDRVDVSVMVLPGANPATYEPKPKQMVSLTQSQIYFAVGVPFETVWLEKFGRANPRMKIIATQEGIEKFPMKGKEGRRQKGSADIPRTARGILDPHIWLSPPLVMFQARNILRALEKADPAGTPLFQANYRKFIAELVDLDLKIGRLFADLGPDRRFMVYHPAWGYFARAYGLAQIPVQAEGKDPTPRALQHLIHEAAEKGIRTIFVQPQFSSKSAETIARAIGGRVIVADPLALEWAQNLLNVAEQFRSSLKRGPDK